MWYIALVIIALALFILWKWHALAPYNQKPLQIETFDGLDSPYHPSVLFFENGWNGWRYWMAETPFSSYSQPYRDRNECPSIHVSMDGIHWQIPEGVTNPLVDLNEQQILDLDYYSDPQLLFVKDHLELYFRITERHGNHLDFSDMTLCRIQSKDGKQWSNLERCFRPGYDLVSPGMTFDAENGYRMWYVNSESHVNVRQIAFTTSRDGMSWTESDICNLKGAPVNPWHIDMQRMDDNLYLTVYDYNEITLWRGHADSPTEFEYMQTVIQPAYKKYGSFYSNGLYRACLVKTDQGVEMFFSADDCRNTFVGRLLCDSISDNSVFRYVGPEGYHANFIKFLKEII
jgi:hypothetical protein